MPITPDWKKWRHAPEVNLREGVALSLDIDPSEIDVSDYRGMVEAFSHSVSGENRAEFNRRVFIAERHLVVNRSLKRTGNSDSWGSPLVSLSNFAAWARSMRWTIPKELAEIASDSQTPEADKPLGNRERDNLHNIIGALYEMIEGALPGMDKHPSFVNQATLIVYLADKYDGIGGLSVSNLQRLLPAAKKSLQ